MVEITKNVIIPAEEIEFAPIRAQGPGGQHVNKSSTAVQLRFSIPESSLPDHYKNQILKSNDQRIASDGTVVIKAQQYRSLERNKQDALSRLRELTKRAIQTPRKRVPTKPGKAAREKRLEKKTHRSKIKAMRGKVEF